MKTRTALAKHLWVGTLLFAWMASAFAAPFAYVLNNAGALSAGTVSVIDIATNTTSATVTAGLQSVAIAVRPGGARAYVANFTSNSVSVIDTATNSVVATVSGVPSAAAIAVTPDGGRVYVTSDTLSPTVSVIDASTNTIIGTIAVGVAPDNIAISPDGTRAYVADFASNRISVIDTSTNSVVANIPVAGNPDGVAVSPDNARVYVTSQSLNTVSVIDAATNTVITTVPTGAMPAGVAVSSARAFVANQGDSTVTVIDTGTNSVVATVSVGLTPFGIDVGPDGNAYVGNQDAGTVSIIDPATNTVVATLGAGGFPQAIAIGGPLSNPAASSIVVTTADSGAGSLRDAINSANACTGLTSIAFAIPGPGPHRIRPLSQLPPLTCPGASIDGYTQAGAALNSDVTGGNNASIQISLDGSLCGACDGLQIQAPSAVVRGLAIYSFGGSGIVSGGVSVSVVGNYLGTDPGGINAFGNAAAGVKATAGFMLLGGSDPADRNLIAANSIGAWLTGNGTADIVGNQIGGRRDGGAGNGNLGRGIFFNGVTSSRSSVAENFVRYNGAAGIVVDAGTVGSVTVIGNASYGNAGIGIDIGDDGPSANDEAASPYDLDSVQNHPVITSVAHVGADTVVSGYLKSRGSPQSIELYHNSVMNSLTEGERLIDIFNVALDANGFAAFTRTISGFLADNVTAATTVDWCNDACFRSSEYSPKVAAIAPGVTLTPPSLTFASRSISTTSPAQTVTLANTGSSTLAISSISVSGDFAFTSACGATLASGSTCTLDVTFTPIAAGARSGALTIVSDAPGSPHTVALSGTGQAGATAIIQIAPTAGTFAPQEVQATSDPELFVITNVGNATLTFSDISVAGDGFALLPDVSGSTYQRCGAAIESGSVCAVQVSFTPPAAGPVEGILTITGNASNSPVAVRLVASGVVTAPPRALSVAASLAFAAQPVGTRSDARALSISNDSSSPVSITELSATGDFSVSDTCTTIPAHGGCAPLVTFGPTALGALTGTLTIRASSEADPYLVDLTGTGIFSEIPQVSLSVTRLGFGDTLIGGASASRLVLTNVGAVPVVLESVIGGGSFFAGSTCPISIPVHGTCEIAVTFFPRLVGLRTGTVEIRTNAAGSPHGVQVSGVGCAIPSISRTRSGQPVCG